MNKVYRYIEIYFRAKRFSEYSHLGLGDIRLTVAEQEEILKIITDKLDSVKGEILNALQTDGGHHKQWYLEYIYNILYEDVAEQKEKYEWQEGIAP